MNLNQLFALSSLITALCNLGLSIFVCVRAKGKQVRRAFFILFLSVGIWSLGLGLEVLSSTREMGLFWARFLHAGVIFIPSTYLHFVFVLVGRFKKGNKFLICGYFVSFILFIINFTPLIVKDVGRKFYFNYYTEAGSLYFLLMLFFMVYVTYAFKELLLAHKRFSGYKRNQVKYFLFAATIGFGAGSITYLPVFNISIPSFIMLLVALHPFIVAYAITSYSLLGIKIAIGKLFAPFLSLTVFSLILFIIRVPLDTDLSKILFGLSCLLFFSVLSKSFSLLIGRFFPKKNYADLLYEFNRKLGECYSISEVFKYVVQVLQDNDSPQPKEGLIFWQKVSEHPYILQKSFGVEQVKDDEISVFSYLAQFLEAKYIAPEEDSEIAPILIKDALHKIFHETEIREMKKELDVLNTQICIPLIYNLDSKRYLLGMICLGEPELSDVYDDKDYDFFKDIAKSLSQAIINVEARKTVNEKNRLSFLSKMFVGWRHQITNILNNINVAAYGIKFIEDSQEINNVAQQIYDNSIKAGKILDQSSQFTKLINPDELLDISLYAVFQEVIESKKSTDNVQIINELSKNLPNIEGDRKCIQTSFLYLIENAIHAVSISNREAGKGYVTIRGHLNKYGTDIEIEIEDNGTGMSPKTLKDLGTPFVMPDDVKGTPTGTALSVALVYYYIQNLHNGKVRVESQLGLGSTFYITVPIKYNRTEI